MNRRERRKLGKAGAAAPAAATSAPLSVSAMLMGLAGQQAPLAVEAAAAPQADPVQSLLARERQQRDLAEELARQQRALAAEPDSELLLRSVGRLQLRLERRADALITYRRLLHLQPDHAEAAHLAAILSGVTPEKADADYVAKLFDAFADNFDRTLTHWLEYRAPQHVAMAAREALGGRVADHALDLGCGTGLLAPELTGLVRRLDGIDLSPRMIEKAAERKLYHQLDVAEIVAYLAARPARYDLLLAADVLAYFGRLDDVFAAAKAALQADGRFVATIERHPAEGFVAAKSGRFAHSESYLRQTAEQAGFRLLSLKPVDLRLEDGKPVPGLVFALGL
ncbi:methyltransferase domain-containing protein [Ferrovibrio sp.]|uniref:class I SAM-dependent DNA methyltransferase n=1 Tax=Ferrovibrio sp. TaxID=1917215 RepID=UPI003D145DF9